jgi:cytochrome P450
MTKLRGAENFPLGSVSLILEYNRTK